MDYSTPGFPILHYLLVCSNACPLSLWCHPTISSSVAPFSSCPKSFPASGGQNFPDQRLLLLSPQEHDWFLLSNFSVNVTSRGPLTTWSNPSVRAHFSPPGPISVQNPCPSLWFPGTDVVCFLSACPHWNVSSIRGLFYCLALHPRAQECLILSELLINCGEWMKARRKWSGKTVFGGDISMTWGCQAWEVRGGEFQAEGIDITKLVGRNRFGMGKVDRKERKKWVRGEGPRAKRILIKRPWRAGWEVKTSFLKGQQALGDPLRAPKVCPWPCSNFSPLLVLQPHYEQVGEDS